MKTASFFCILACWTGFASHAQEVVLKGDKTNAKIMMTPFGSTKGKVVVAWEDLAGASGAMIYDETKETNEIRYLATGGVGLFALVDRDEHRKVNGSDVAVYRMIEDDPNHPQIMKVTGEKPRLEDLMKRYYQSQGFAEGASKAEVQKGLDAKTSALNSACGGSIATEIKWADFEKGGKWTTAAAAGAVLDGIAKACADQDYKAEIAKLKKIRFAGASGADLNFEKSGSQVSVGLAEPAVNPRERAKAWIEKNL